MTYARHESPSSSVVRASDQCTEEHGSDSRRGLRFFSHARDMLNIPPFLNPKVTEHLARRLGEFHRHLDQRL